MFPPGFVRFTRVAQSFVRATFFDSKFTFLSRLADSEMRYIPTIVEFVNEIGYQKCCGTII